MGVSPLMLVKAVVDGGKALRFERLVEHGFQRIRILNYIRTGGVSTY